MKEVRKEEEKLIFFQALKSAAVGAVKAKVLYIIQGQVTNFNQMYFWGGCHLITLKWEMFIMDGGKVFDLRF